MGAIARGGDVFLISGLGIGEGDGPANRLHEMVINASKNSKGRIIMGLDMQLVSWLVKGVACMNMLMRTQKVCLTVSRESLKS